MIFRLPAKFPLLPRAKKSDKADYGHVLVLAGSRSMTGAAVLTSEAALLSGSGLVTLGLPGSLLDRMPSCPPEIMRLVLPQTKAGSVSAKAFAKVRNFIKKRKINALAIGPGLSQNADTQNFVRKTLKKIEIPAVLDADGLNSFKGKADLLRRHHAPLVLTPHKREFERLFDQTLPERGLKRIALAKKLSRFYHVVLVIKGHRSLVVEADRVYVNTTGNPGMAKGGTGDVLTGIIGSFIGQGLDVFSASAWAVYCHGKAGDRAARSKGELSLTASDIIRNLPRVFRELSVRRK